jgi:hypothetical protein
MSNINIDIATDKGHAPNHALANTFAAEIAILRNDLLFDQIYTPTAEAKAGSREVTRQGATGPAAMTDRELTTITFQMRLAALDAKFLVDLRHRNTAAADLIERYKAEQRDVETAIVKQNVIIETTNARIAEIKHQDERKDAAAARRKAAREQQRSIAPVRNPAPQLSVSQPAAHGFQLGLQPAPQLSASSLTQVPALPPVQLVSSLTQVPAAPVGQPALEGKDGKHKPAGRKRKRQGEEPKTKRWFPSLPSLPSLPWSKKN